MIAKHLGATISLGGLTSLPHMNSSKPCAGAEAENETTIAAIGAWLNEQHLQPDVERLSERLAAALQGGLGLGGWPLERKPSVDAVRAHLDANW